jgi:DNA adenine methylase
MAKVIIPPIKSQGIKSKLVPWINALIPEHQGRWIEPFMGTGVVAFNVKSNEYLLSDINPHLINFYNAIKYNDISSLSVKKYLENEGLKLKFAENDGYEHYKFIKERFNEYFNPLDFLFLSRAGFNGMIRFNGKGKWNIPFCKKPERFCKSYITKIVNQVSKVSQLINENWIFVNKDFREIISLATEDDFIYCDPPYHGRYVDYYNGWSNDDENDLYELLANTKAQFILSTWHHNDYRQNEMIEQYWNKFNIITKDHFYHSGGKIEKRNSIVEALVFNFETNICEHNYKPIENEIQFTLFNRAPKYKTKPNKIMVN